MKITPEQVKKILGDSNFKECMKCKHDRMKELILQYREGYRDKESLKEMLHAYHSGGMCWDCVSSLQINVGYVTAELNKLIVDK